MDSLNLSKLVLGDHFIDLLKEEGISFDRIISDNKKFSNETNVEIILGHLEEFFSKIDSNEHTLIILDKLGINDIFPYVSKMKKVCIISSNSHLASFTRKISPEIDYLGGLYGKIKIAFPWDLENLIKTIKSEEKVFIPLNNQEVPDNIYASTNQEEEIQFIDKSIIEKKDILSLLSPDKPDICLIGLGNHFEELVKLSQLLATNEARIALHVINQWDLIFSDKVKELYKDAKKIGIIFDHLPNKKLIEKLKVLGKPLELITPHYEKLTSIFAEYQFEQSDFNAIALYERVLELL